MNCKRNACGPKMFTFLEQYLIPRELILGSISSHYFSPLKSRLNKSLFSILNGYVTPIQTLSSFPKMYTTSEAGEVNLALWLPIKEHFHLFTIRRREDNKAGKEETPANLQMEPNYTQLNYYNPCIKTQKSRLPCIALRNDKGHETEAEADGANPLGKLPTYQHFWLIASGSGTARYGTLPQVCHSHPFLPGEKVKE